MRAGPLGRRAAASPPKPPPRLDRDSTRTERMSNMPLRSTRGGSVDEPRKAMNQNRALKTTARQKKWARIEIRRYIHGVGFRGLHHDAFRSERLAKCYAVAILLERSIPEPSAEAGALLACLFGDPYEGIMDYVRRPTPKALSIRDRALGTLVRRYGYPDHRWLQRLNEDIRSRELTLDAQERDLMSRDPDLYRRVIIDPAFRDEREGRRQR